MTQALPHREARRHPTPTELMDIYRPVLGSLKSVNDLLEAQIRAGHKILAERLLHAGLTSGKRMRPALLLLSAACFGDIKKTHTAAAAAIELVHCATLVHDDVLDGADQRRHQSSMNSRWNNTTSILTGDYLFSKAFDICCSSGSMEVMRRVSKSSCRVCEGEVIQNARAGNLSISEQEYIEIVALKTAELCRCACGLGAVLTECDPSTVQAFERFGEDLGIAFQIIDDVLDLVGLQERMGKTLGTDLSGQKLTLPLIHCLSHLPSNDRLRLIQYLSSGQAELAEVRHLLERSGSVEYARQAARQRATSALDFAHSLPRNPHSASLVQLASFVIERTF